MKYLIEANFHVFLPAPGGSRTEPKRAFGRGQVIDESDIPDGHTGDDWVARGLAKAVEQTAQRRP